MRAFLESADRKGLRGLPMPTMAIGSRAGSFCSVIIGILTASFGDLGTAKEGVCLLERQRTEYSAGAGLGQEVCECLLFSFEIAPVPACLSTFLPSPLRRTDGPPSVIVILSLPCFLASQPRLPTCHDSMQHGRAFPSPASSMVIHDRPAAARHTDSAVSACPGLVLLVLRLYRNIKLKMQG